MSFVSPTAMVFPSYVNGKLVNENGEITPDWNIYLSQLTQNLQFNFSEDGITIPSEPAAAIANLVAIALDTGATNNKMLVNEDTGDVQIILNGVLKTFTLT